MASVVGPGGTTSKAGCKTGMSIGPGGAGGGAQDVTMKRGYDSKRTQGLRNDYQVTGKAENGKASK